MFRVGKGLVREEVKLKTSVVKSTRSRLAWLSLQTLVEQSIKAPLILKIGPGNDTLPVTGFLSKSAMETAYSMVI